MGVNLGRHREEPSRTRTQFPFGNGTRTRQSRLVPQVQKESQKPSTRYEYDDEYEEQSNAAILQQYDETVQCLLEAFPGGAFVADYDGVSPLMVAAKRNVSLNVIFQLVTVDPIAATLELLNA